MFKRYIVVLFSLVVIPTMADGSLMPWRTWLNMHSTLEAIVECESNYNKNAVGDHGNSYGIFQIHLPAHKDITKQQALNPYWAISWAIDQEAKGNIGIWSCYHLLVNRGEIEED